MRPSLLPGPRVAPLLAFAGTLALWAAARPPGLVASVAGLALARPRAGTLGSGPAFRGLAAGLGPLGLGRTGAGRSPAGGAP